MRISDLGSYVCASDLYGIPMCSDDVELTITTAFEQKAGSLSRSVPEVDCLGAVRQHAAIKVETDGARQHPAFDIPSLADEIVRGVVMADPLDILFDARAFVQIGGDIMGGRADPPHAPRVGLMIGLCHLHTAEEAVRLEEPVAGDR